MQTSMRSESGFSLIETMVSMLVLSVGVLGLSQAFISGVQKSSSSPYEVLATQKAAEAVESGACGATAHHQLGAHEEPERRRRLPRRGDADETSGNDGIVNTADDGAVESFIYPVPTATSVPRTTRPSRSTASPEKSISSSCRDSCGRSR
jgi:prepilin-type N-terminal cleavage/methylation domain-containing protein